MVHMTWELLGAFFKILWVMMCDHCPSCSTRACTMFFWLQVKKEFPELEVFADRVSLDAFGYAATWQVGQNATNLMEAATLAQTFVKAGKTQMQKLDALNRRLAVVTGDLRCLR